MSHAVIVRVDGRQAGVAVRLTQRRYRFFSTIREAYPIEERTFKNLEEISGAVREAIASQRRSWPEIGVAVPKSQADASLATTSAWL